VKLLKIVTNKDENSGNQNSENEMPMLSKEKNYNSLYIFFKKT